MGKWKGHHMSEHCVWTKFWEFHSGKDRTVFRSVRFWGKQQSGMLSFLGRWRMLLLDMGRLLYISGKASDGEAREKAFSLKVCETFRFCCFREYGFAHIKHEKISLIKVFMNSLKLLSCNWANTNTCIMHLCGCLHKDYILDLILQLEKLPCKINSSENFRLVFIAIRQPSISV